MNLDRRLISRFVCSDCYDKLCSGELKEIP